MTTDGTPGIPILQAIDEGGKEPALINFYLPLYLDKSDAILR